MHSTRRGPVYLVTNDPIPNGNAVPTYVNDGAGNLSPLPGSPFKTNGTGYTTKHDIFDDGSLQPVPGSPFPLGWQESRQHRLGRRQALCRQGSVLVKEVFEATTGTMTTGTVSHADKLKGWFVMVKDSKNSHPGNRLWGEGWGWSWFDAANPVKTTSKDFRTDCLGCHIPAKATDWIYVSGYPGLKK